MGPMTSLPWGVVANASRARHCQRDPDNGARREIADRIGPESTALAHRMPACSLLGSARFDGVLKAQGREHEAP
jgi:hypothetical protein